MNAKRTAKVAAGMEKFTEPGEQVTRAVSARGGSPWAIFLAAIPVLSFILLKPRIVVATDRNIYVMQGMGKPSQQLAKYPLDSTPVSIGKKRLAQLELNVGPTTVWAPAVEHKAARELAESTRSAAQSGSAPAQ